MSKLRGAKKEEFLKRMAAGRRKAARANGSPKKAAKEKTKRPQSKRTPREKHLAAMRKVVRTGKGQAELEKTRSKLKRRNAGPRSVRKSKKAMKKFLPGFKRKKRRNQEEGMQAAERTFEMFHQSAARRTIEYDQLYKYPAEFAELGKLKELRFDLDNANRDFPLTHFGNCLVVVTPDGSNIYFLGGDQKVDLPALDISSDKDLVELGPCRYIMYHTMKGFHDFESIDYFHRFGKEDGIFPNLVYDRLNQALFLVSGNYRVRAAGIEN